MLLSNQELDLLQEWPMDYLVPKLVPLPSHRPVRLNARLPILILERLVFLMVHPSTLIPLPTNPQFITQQLLSNHLVMQQLLGVVPMPSKLILR